ncbi:unnamed protein product, partial [Symbiodinium microadriaticum]
KDEAAGEAKPKGKGKTESRKGSGKDEATGEATQKGKGKARSTKGSGKDEVTGEAGPKGKGKTESRKGSGKDEAREATQKGKGKARSTKGSGKGEATGEAGPKGKGKAESQTKGSGKKEATGEAETTEATGEAEAKGKGKTEAPNGSGKDEAAGEAKTTEATGEAEAKGKGKAKSPSKGAAQAEDEDKASSTPPETPKVGKGKGHGATETPQESADAVKRKLTWSDQTNSRGSTASADHVQKLTAEKIEQILEMLEPGQLDLPTRFAFLKAFVQHKDMPDIEDPKNPEMRIYTVFRDIKAARAAFAETMQNKVVKVKEKMEKGRARRLRNLGDKALTAATNLKSTGLKRQEAKPAADIKHMGEVNVHCYSILKECNSILFSAEPLSKAREFLESKAHQLEEYAKDVAHAEGVFQTFERRKAAEKRKREKEELKKKATVDCLESQAGSADQEDWPDENEVDDDDKHEEEWADDGQEYDDDDHEVNLDAAGDVESGWHEHSMFLPHEVMGSIYDFDPQLFHKFFGRPEALWDAEDFIVPVRLYGDGAESYRTQNFEIFLLQIVLDAFQMDQEFITKCFRLQSCVLEVMNLSGFMAGALSLGCILPDVMHIIHLACLGDVLTSMLLDLSDDQFPWPGSSRDTRLEHGWKSYKGYCQRWGIEDRAERRLFTNEVLKADFVTVSQKIMRAAAAKYMIFWLHWLMEGLLQGDPEKPEHLKLILGVVTGLMHFEQTQMENGRYFTEEQCRFCESAYYLYRASYDRLASMALAQGIPRWKVRPKQHMLEHEVIDFMCEYRLNPRYSANYMGEDAVRRVKQLAVASHPNHVSRHVLSKWSLQFSLPYRRA